MGEERNWLKPDKPLPYMEINDTVIVGNEEIAGCVWDALTGKKGLVIRVAGVNIIILLTDEQLDVTTKKWKEGIG